MFFIKFKGTQKECHEAELQQYCVTHGKWIVVGPKWFTKGIIKSIYLIFCINTPTVCVVLRATQMAFLTPTPLFPSPSAKLVRRSEKLYGPRHRNNFLPQSCNNPAQIPHCSGKYHVSHCISPDFPLLLRGRTVTTHAACTVVMMMMMLNKWRNPVQGNFLSKIKVRKVLVVVPFLSKNHWL